MTTITLPPKSSLVNICHLGLGILVLVLGLLMVNNNPSSAAFVPEGLSATEWDTVQAQIIAGKYHTYATETGDYVSSNPAHGWQIVYKADGTTTLTSHDPAQDWNWGLQLTSYGYAPILLDTNGQLPDLVADQETLTYQWDSNLSEWWINTANGLEQGFTLQHRPGQADGLPLQIEMVAHSDLLPIQQGNTIIFYDKTDAITFTYGSLFVTDADSQVIPAQFSLAPSEGSGVKVRILVDDAQARYPLTIDPLLQNAFIKASNTGMGDAFGNVVALSGDTLVVGAIQEGSNATGINGDQVNNLAGSSGAAYVFIRNGTTWSQQAYLKASNTDTGDRFARSVAINGDTIVVGAFSEGSNDTGVNGDQANNDASSSGAAYVFTRNGTTWNQQAYLKASNTGANDYFGWSVAVSGDTIVVGAYGEDSNAMGISGNQANNSASNSGAAYVFTRNGIIWSQQAYLKASNTGSYDYFGWSVAVSDDTVVVGALQEASADTGVNGNQADNNARWSGAAYVFTRSGTTWSQQAYLKASNTDESDSFGEVMAISGDTLVVGAKRESSSATGVNGDDSDNSANRAGAAYVFTRIGTTWSQQAYLKASNTEVDDYFGNAVAISGDTVMVGAYQEDSNASGVNGNEDDNSASQSGATFVFTRSGSTWQQQTYLKASNTEASDEFGNAVAVSSDTLVVSATGEDSNATGINGNQANNDGLGSGATYVFTTCTRSAQSGNWHDAATWENAAIPTINDSICIQNGHTVTLTANAVADTLWVRSGGVLDLDIYTLAVETKVTNDGTLQQTKDVGASSTVNFLQIQPDGGGVDRYRGLDMTTDASNNLSTTFVSIKGNTAVCNNPANDGGAYRNRCFMVNPANAGTVNIILHTTPGEDDISDDAFFQYASGTTWTQWTVTCNDGVGMGDPCPGSATFASPAWFLIGSQANKPTAVSLSSFSAADQSTGMVALIVGVLVLLLGSLWLRRRVHR